MNSFVILVLGFLALLANGNPITKFDPNTDINLRLFTRRNPTESQIIINGDNDSLLASNLNLSNSLKLYAHGRLSPWESPELVDAILNNTDANFIIIDWTAGSYETNETLLVERARQTGQYVASFIDWLNTLGLPLTDVQVIGFSIGSHVAGFTGRFVQNGKVEYVTGLDPPISAFEIGGDHINANDANYVEIIHTNGGESSINVPVGTADFYPNAGRDQPGCNGSSLCNHMRAVTYFTESIGKTDFGAMKCNNFEEIQNGDCADINRSYMGGTGAAKNITGVYYLSTNAESPFAQGDYFNPRTQIFLKLYTRQNPTTYQILQPNNMSSLNESNFNLQNTLKIFHHGWAPRWEEPELVAAWLANEDANVILVDWTAATATSNEALMVSRVPLVGQYVASFIDWVSGLGIQFNQTHVVGMSVGSHVAGHSARFCRNGIIEYVTGCDPPRRFWQDNGEGLNPNDGKYVEVIHTSTLAHSFVQPHGTADFYPNGGETMPGCDGNDLCDHMRALEYFVESIGNRNFASMKCNNYEEIVNNTCADLERSYLGDTGSAKNITGVFYLTTNAESPFAQGDF